MKPKKLELAKKNRRPTEHQCMHTVRLLGHSRETLHRTHTDVSVYLTWKRDTGSVWMKDSTEFPLSLNIRASFYLEYSRFFFCPSLGFFLLMTQVWSLSSRHIQKCDPHSGFVNSFGGRLVEDESPWVACDLFRSQFLHLWKKHCLEQWLSTCATRRLCGVK